MLRFYFWNTILIIIQPDIENFFDYRVIIIGAIDNLLKTVMSNDGQAINGLDASSFSVGQAKSPAYGLFSQNFGG